MHKLMSLHPVHKSLKVYSRGQIQNDLYKLTEYIDYI